jgi:CBS domain-containing protein
MDDIFVASLMSPDVVTVARDTFVEEAAKRLRENRIGSLVVVDDGDRLEGILTSTDFIDIVALSKPKADTTVGRYMTEEVVTVGPQEPIRKAADRMITYNVHHLPVVDDEERVIGMLSTTDLTAYISDARQSSAA